MQNIGFDTETYLIGPPDRMIPPIVCGSWDLGNERSAQSIYSTVSSTGDPISLYNNLMGMWQAAYDGNYRIVIHNARFDVNVCLRYCQEVMNGTLPGPDENPKGKARELYLTIWETLEKSLDNEWDAVTSQFQNPKPVLVSCTMIREKLKNLSAHGDIQFVHGREARYGLANLVMKYLGIDLFDKKTVLGANGRILDYEGNDITGTLQAGSSWRLRYSELDKIPTKDWPREAYDYALSDSYYARLVWDEQEKKRRNFYHYSMNSESLQVYADVCLGLMTAQGFRIDAEQRDRVTKQVGDHLDKLNAVLRNQGVLRANGSCNTQVVKDRVAAIYEGWLGSEPLLTEHGDIATGKEVLEQVAPFDPVLQLYAERQKLSKIWTAFLPNLQGARVYTDFDILKETGRTSSKGSKKVKNREPLYPAVNSQQIPRQPGIREMFLPEEKYLVVSVDYGALELCSTAQATYSLFGFSVHRDKINAGYDLHSYMGASIAMKTAQALVDDELTDRDAAYQAFMAHRQDKVDPEDFSQEAELRRELAKQAKKFRNLAKPVGLGYPGGLSVKTLCVFAKATYHVDIDEKQSAELRELWFETYPEMVEFFKWVRQQVDGSKTVSDKKLVKYAYETFGFRRFRSGATYCATANGTAMQSLAADGGKRSLCWVTRAAMDGLRDKSCFSILNACAPLTFIHDENLIGVPDDILATERCLAVERLMVAAMGPHMPDVRISAEPALSRRWTKAAEPEWEYAPGERQKALRYCAEVYGPEVAAAVERDLKPPEGKRLRPWDDHNKLPEMTFGA